MKGETQGDFQEAPAWQRTWREGAGWSGLEQGNGQKQTDLFYSDSRVFGPVDGLTQGVSDGDSLSDGSR